MGVAVRTSYIFLFLVKTKASDSFQVSQLHCMILFISDCGPIM